MKYLRTLAGMSIVFVIVFMVIALFRYQHDEDMSMLPSQFEVSGSLDWSMAVLEGRADSGFELAPHESIRLMYEDAEKQGKSSRIELPYEGTSGAGDIVVYVTELFNDYEGMTLSFSTVDSAVRVVLDDEVLYEYGTGEGDGTVPSGIYEHFIDMPNTMQNGEFWIELVSQKPDAAASLEYLVLKNRDVTYIGIVGGSIADIGCCLLLVIISILMFAIAAVRRYTRQPARGELFMGFVGLAAGTFYFIETDTLSIFYGVYEAYEIQEYLVLLIPLFLALYYERALHGVYPKRFAVLLAAIAINAAAQILLQLLGIWQMHEMIGITAVFVSGVCVAAIVSLIQFAYQNRSFQALLSVLAVVILLSGGAAHIILNLLIGRIPGKTASQYGMTVFGLIMSIVHIMQLSKEYRIKVEENACLLQQKVKEAEQQNIRLAKAKEEADAARHEAMAANEAKGKFLAHMSHEIRTPINAVLGMDQMILRESKEKAVKEYAMDIYTAGQTLLSLINDILDFSKIESGKMEIVPVEYEISSMLHDLINMALQRAEGKDLKLEVEIDHQIPSKLYGDDVRIRQVITNILTNAVKYTHEGTVWLRVKSSRDEAGMVKLRVEVEDTGIGIKEEDLPKLAAEFERIEEDRNRNIEGTGLGMNITIQLLSLLGSRMQVESVYGKGSKFYFDLEQKIIDDTPVGDFRAKVRQAAEDFTYSAKLYAPEAEILVVDDNAVNRKVLRNLLKETQIQVTDAQGGAECLELVRHNRYDVIFLDHMMPEMDGVETLHYMKAMDDYPCKDTPVVVLTANAVSGAKEKYLQEGFDGFLSKPIVPEKLEHMLKEMLADHLLKEAPADPSGADGPNGADTKQMYDLMEQLPQVDGLDWQYAWMHLPDLELLEYTVKEFYAQIDSAADRLEGFYRQMDGQEAGTEHGLEQYRIQVHAMKSLAATIGIMPLSGVAKILEYAARDGKTEVVRSITPAFLEEWRSYRMKLHGVFGIETEVKKEVKDYSVMQALVEMVRLSMQELDIDQADELIGRLRAYEYPEEMGQNIQKLAEAVNNLDPEETDRAADLLTGQMEQAADHSQRQQCVQNEQL